MNVNKLITCILATIIFGMQPNDIWGFKTMVWENPLARSVAASCSQVVEKVEFKPDETVVTLKVYSSTPFSYNEGTELYADGKTYAMKSYEGFEPGKYNRPENGVADIVMRFEPLPVNTTNFTLREPVNIKRGFFIENIHPITDNFMESSLWRNDATGEWLIGFFPEGAVYDGKFWRYGTTQLDKDTTKGKVTLINGDKTINVNIGKQKNLKRQIRIGNEKPIECSMITGSRLPDYPTKDLRPNLADNGYHPGDSIEISGWLRGPRKKSRPVEIQLHNVFTGNTDEYQAQQDSNGFFAVKLPVINTQTAYIRTDREILTLPLEPDQKYFILIDYASGKKVMMGIDCRLQNEILTCPLNRWMNSAYEYKERMDQFFPDIKDFDEKSLKALNNYTGTHPNVSERYKTYVGHNLKSNGAFTLGQGYFYLYPYPEDMMVYARGNYIDSFPSPLSPYRLYGTFINNIVDAAYESSKSVFRIPIMVNGHNGWINMELTDEGADKTIDLKKKLLNLRRENEFKHQLSDEETAIQHEIYMIDSIARTKMSEKELLDLEFDNRLKIMDSLKINDEAKDIFLTQYFNEIIEHSMQPLQVHELANAKKYIKNKVGLQYILDLNDKYVRLQNNDVPLRNKTLQFDSTLTNGKELFDKILEPMRGKIILIDVWGTWCGPCKAALKNFKEEEQYLRKYDIAYLFLANRSPEAAWKTVINEYGLDGDNIFHYNLPDEQQSAIQNYLGVTGFPSYFLVNQQGEIVDLKVDARDIDELEKLIKKLKATESN